MLSADWMTLSSETHLTEVTLGSEKTGVEEAVVHRIHDLIVEAEVGAGADQEDHPGPCQEASLRPRGEAAADPGQSHQVLRRLKRRKSHQCPSRQSKKKSPQMAMLAPFLEACPRNEVAPELPILNDLG